MTALWHYLPLESGRHYEDSTGRRVIITKITQSQVAYGDVIDQSVNPMRTTYDTFYADTGVSFSQMHNPRIVGYWVGTHEPAEKAEDGEPECKCSSKALFSYGHEHGCEWVKVHGEHRHRG